MRQYRCSHWLLVALACIVATIARAEVHVEGNLAAMRVTTSQEAISDVLSALASPLHVIYRSSIRLDASADEIYSGSLREVVARLLDGYNYVLTRDGEKIEIIVLGRWGKDVYARPPASPASKAGRERP
jgi:hypothetical protein